MATIISTTVAPETSYLDNVDDYDVEMAPTFGYENLTLPCARLKTTAPVDQKADTEPFPDFDGPLTWDLLGEYVSSNGYAEDDAYNLCSSSAITGDQAPSLEKAEELVGRGLLAYIDEFEYPDVHRNDSVAGDRLWSL